MCWLSYAPRQRTIIVLVVVGLLARLLGVLFNGMHDVDQIVLVWGMAVREEGLGPAFAGVYGVFSYALFGAAAEGVTLIPRFWWAPYKLIVIGSEAGIFACLVFLLPAGRRFWALPFFWLNPWFVVHGAWQGYWDGPYTLFGLLALVILRAVRGEVLAWALAGAVLMMAALLKPQGLAYFVLPMGVYVLCLARAQRSLVPLISYSVGAVSLLFVGSWALDATGGDSVSQVSSFLSAAATMPTLCNNCVGIWRPITGMLQAWLGQEGPAYALALPPVLESRLDQLGLALGYGTIVLAAVRLAWSSRLAPRPSDRVAAGVLMTMAALAIPQLATHAHSNHTYAGIVLLIPLLMTDRIIRIGWILMVGVMFYAHLAAYQLGRAVVLATDAPVYRPGPVWVQNLGAVQDASTHDGLLIAQGAVNAFVTQLAPVEPFVTVLSVVMFAAVVCVLWRLLDGRSVLRVTSDPDPGALLSAWAVSPGV
jgi:hypothetical protein